eukprot:m.34874 g.34874  ORF g.34874 m.34874 type:complete len:834 (-) comp9557_c0_seq2:88-2589(-)
MESSKEKNIKRGRRRSANITEDDVDEIALRGMSPVPASSRSSQMTSLASGRDDQMREGLMPNPYSAQRPPSSATRSPARSTNTSASSSLQPQRPIEIRAGAPAHKLDEANKRFEFDVNDAKLLRLQFAKHDLDRDGRLDAPEFRMAYQSSKAILPALGQQSSTVAEANFQMHQRNGKIDLEGFLQCVNSMYHTVVHHQRKQAHAAPGPDSSGMVAFGSDPRKATAASSLRGMGQVARDWFGVSEESMAHAQDDFVNRKTLERESSMRGARFAAAARADQTPTITYADRGKGKGGDEDDEDAAPAPLPPPNIPHRLIYNEKEAMAYYKQYVQKEQEAQRKAKSAALLERDKEKEKEKEREKGKGGPASRRSAANTPRRGRRLDTMVRAQLRALPTFTPYFIYFITFLQFSVLVVICALSYTEGQFAAVGLGTTYKTCTLSPASEPPCPDTLECGTCYDTSLRRPTVSNMWIGPNTNYLLAFGAKYSLCMRSDNDLNAELAATRGRECGIAPNMCVDGGWAQGKGFSCCTIAGNGRSGMTDNATCASVFGTWTGAHGQNTRCDEMFTNVVLRPCCVGNTGTCRLLTHSQCQYINGTFHTTAQLCSDVMCLADVCQMRTGPTISASRTFANQPDSPNQWWRFITPLFVHAGVLHFAIVSIVQVYVGTKIEKTAGLLRTLLIYFISGVGGYIVSGSFTPRTVDVGANPAVFGLLAVLLAELLQSWQLVINPLLHLTKLLVVLAVAMALGTFPYLNNFSHLGGFLFGFLAAIVFLPYITFGKWDVARKLTMVIVCFIGLVVIFVLALLLFYLIQNTSFCSWCHYLDCVPYSSSIDCSA